MSHRRQTSDHRLQQAYTKVKKTRTSDDYDSRQFTNTHLHVIAYRNIVFSRPASSFYEEWVGGFNIFSIQYYNIRLSITWPFHGFATNFRSINWLSTYLHDNRGKHQTVSSREPLYLYL